MNASLLVIGEGGKSASSRRGMGILGGRAMQPFCSSERLAETELMAASSITANRE